MDCLNLRRLESDFLINLANWCVASWCLANWLIDLIGFRRYRLLPFYWSAQLGRQGRDRDRR